MRRINFLKNTFANFSIGVIIGTQRMPQKLGFTNITSSTTPISVVSGSPFSINDSITFQNDEPNNQLTLIFRLLFANATGGNLYIQGASGSPATANTYLILTRIA